MAFVMVNAELGIEKQLAKELSGIDGVKEVNIVYGVYDLTVKVEAESLDKLKEIISKKIRSLEGVRSTLTMVVI